MIQEGPPMSDPSNGMLSNPMVRALLVFSAFRAVYGMGILVVTYTCYKRKLTVVAFARVLGGHGVLTMALP